MRRTRKTNLKNGDARHAKAFTIKFLKVKNIPYYFYKAASPHLTIYLRISSASRGSLFFFII